MRKKVTQVGRDLATLLDIGMVELHLDATDKLVDVPAVFKQNSHLVLNLSYRFAHADIELGRNKVCATLTFGQEAYRCHIAYRAIFIMQSKVSGAVAIIPENMPPELQALVEKNNPNPEGSKLRVVPTAKQNKGGEPKVSKSSGRPKLQLVDGGLND